MRRFSREVTSRSTWSSERKNPSVPFTFIDKGRGVKLGREEKLTASGYLAKKVFDSPPVFDPPPSTLRSG